MVKNGGGEKALVRDRRFVDCLENLAKMNSNAYRYQLARILSYCTKSEENLNHFLHT